MSVVGLPSLARRAVLALAPLALAACAAGGPMPNRVAAPPIPHRVEWATAEDPRAVILALHGYGDHAASTFHAAAPAWAARGIAVTAYDHRGFGNDPGRGQWPGASTLIADAVAEVARARAEYPETPLFLLGHSMGGGIALAAAGAGAPVDGVILVAPAISGGEAIPPAARLGLWTFTAILPDKRWTGEGLVTLRASDNDEALRRLAADPLYLGSASAREILGLVRVMDAATIRAPDVAVPALVLIGERDEFIPPGEIAESATAIPGLHTVIRYPDGWHLLLRDKQAPRVWADVADWIEGRIAWTD
jgi:alpha-beta hydrolase superfamily lysophospholipase